MWMYALVFFIAMAVDCIPVFAPPAWPILVFFVVKFSLNPWIVTLLGVLGTTIGRGIFSTYIPWLSRKILNTKEDENLKFIGQKVSQTPARAFLFVLLYSLTPLSTTALFTAAGVAKARLLHILPPFFIGKMISYGTLIWLGDYATKDGFLDGSLSLKNIILGVLGLLILGALLFVDWKTLLLKKKLKLRFKIWK
jgi:membrane protein YqaA with SNARE-associated domain